MRVCVCVQPSVVPDGLFVYVCVCHSSYDWMHVGAQSQRKPSDEWASCKANRSESKIDVWR